jgi:hypothetical protein
LLGRFPGFEIRKEHAMAGACVRIVVTARRRHEANICRAKVLGFEYSIGLDDGSHQNAHELSLQRVLACLQGLQA